MTFTQMITVTTDDSRALADHAATWNAEQGGIAPGYLGTRILASRDVPDQYVIEVDFSSEEEAGRNNDRAETAAWAQRLRDLVDTEPTYDSYVRVWTAEGVGAH